MPIKVRPFSDGPRHGNAYHPPTYAQNAAAWRAYEAAALLAVVAFAVVGGSAQP
ncbi:MAG: hypothetical protein JWN27_2937 [Candidatus Eremiobacteraeota bacterium]|nr:hypothetical protein [Candidatus Eremiobacteraeota bacterium]